MDRGKENNEHLFFNVRGLLIPSQRRALFLSFDFIGFDVLFLQECYLKDKNVVEKRRI